ncbi:MAG: Kiwa anti-phage protein KwaB-like domain-containing protein [Dehalococcoidales bacterium]
MIDKEEIQVIINQSLLDEANVGVYLYENKKLKENSVFLYNLNIEQKIVDSIKSIAKAYLSNIAELINNQISDSIPVYNPDDEQVIFKIDSDQIAVFSEIYNIIVNQRLYGRYKKDIIRENKIKAWIFRFEIEIDGKIEQILFFQRFLANKMLKSRGVPIYEVDNEFKLLEGNIISFGYLMELLYFKKTFIATRIAPFEKIFGYEEYYKKCACQLIEDLALKHIPEFKIDMQFENMDDVIHKIQSNIFLAHKFHVAQYNGYYKEMDFSKLEDLDKRYSLGLNLDKVAKKWIIDEHLDLWIIASILNDEYDRSQITPNEYIVFKKRQLQVKLPN